MMTDSSADDPRAARRAALRKATLQLVLGVVVLDAVALGIYYLGGIEHGSAQTKQIFTWVWLVITAITVAFLLKRVRAIRYNRSPQ
jgi:hypothetical protein